MNNSRALVIVFGVIGFFLILIFRLANIQISKHADYDFYAKNQQVEKKILRAERGYIYDRHGELLAYDRNDVTFYLDTRMVKGKQIDSLTARFARVFNKNHNYYKKLIKTSGKNVCLEKKAPADKAIQLEDLMIDGLIAKEDPTRVYCYDNLASHVLGYVGSDYTGIEGIEKYYNKILTGSDGHILIERDVRGRMITVSEESTVNPQPGDNITLTIDKSYQKILEEELKKGLEQYQSNAAVGIIMDPNNGEILALANMPDFNPNNYWSYSNEVRRDRALTDTYEPGSTFKSLTLSTLIDQKLCRNDETVFAENGKYRFKNVNITDSHTHQWLTVREVLEQSSNIGMAKLITRIDEDLFYKYIRNFGFGNYTFIDLPGEAKGMLRKPGNFNELTQAFMSFGYEVSVTPIQLTAAYGALVNGGSLYQPHLLKKIEGHSRQVKEEYNPKLLRSVVTEKTSQKIRELLVGVVENGTAKTAKLTKVTAGGKTGTSQQLVNNKYSKLNYNSTFVGFFPADKPKILCYILFNAPKLGRYGGVVAGPVFKNVAERLLMTDMNLLPGDKDQGKNNFDGMLMASEKKENTQKYSNIAPVQNSNPITREKILNKGIMPDLTKYYLRDALAMLTEIGLKYKVIGNGKIISQSIEPGKAIKPGLVCQIKCEEKKINGARIN